MPFYSSPSAPSPAISGEPLFLSSRPSAHPCHSDQSISLSFRPSAHPCHFERAPSLSFRPSEARGEIRFLGFALPAPLEMTVVSTLRDKAFRLPQGGHIHPALSPHFTIARGDPELSPHFTIARGDPELSCNSPSTAGIANTSNIKGLPFKGGPGGHKMVSPATSEALTH